MQRPFLLGLIALSFAMYACTSSTPPSHVSPTPSAAPAVGDACLVGHWKLTQESVVAPPDSLAGLVGATLLVNPGGDATLTYTHSSPLVGTHDSKPASLAYTGSLRLTLLATSPDLAITYVSSATTIATTYQGSTTTYPFAIPSSPAAATYTCSASALQVVFQSDTYMTTDSYTRG